MRYLSQIPSYLPVSDITCRIEVSMIITCLIAILFFLLLILREFRKEDHVMDTSVQALTEAVTKLTQALAVPNGFAVATDDVSVKIPP